MTLIEAVFAAIAAGAKIENPQSHPMRLQWSGPWLTTLSQEAMVELVAADPAQLDKALSWWVGLNEHMEHYRRALAAGDEQGKAWWRKRLLEDYQYEGPFPTIPLWRGTEGTNKPCGPSQSRWMLWGMKISSRSSPSEPARGSALSSSNDFPTVETPATSRKCSVTSPL
jgi:hypothetical protein